MPPKREELCCSFHLPEFNTHAVPQRRATGRDRKDWVVPPKPGELCCSPHPDIWHVQENEDTCQSETCGEEEVVRSVHTLIAGVVQVYHRLHVVEEEEKGRKARARSRKGRSRRRDHTHVDDHVDDVNGSNILSHGACMCGDE